ncbi:MAG: hypothetical protein AAGA60_22250 [Cyanobacteria bacterium P01_E01_bin.42]
MEGKREKIISATDGKLANKPAKIDGDRTSNLHYYFTLIERSQPLEGDRNFDKLWRFFNPILTRVTQQAYLEGRN